MKASGFKVVGETESATAGEVWGSSAFQFQVFFWG